ncbi:helix-turn-helix domain-containing protein [Limnoraphis robusta]|uniref:helix-turn-helix domain-containing protein n=1 Tax=Limnoraphis robusta TaxID=1118279 RepID=UPI002B1F9272|nr:helix-turn-helix domain-containing protein [Limnoraphis robusta]MEA5501234.1 helix-turn-helix domain-containing protein [Limnoraphis robusta BA-68 BA1]
MTRKTDLASHYSTNELKQKYLKSKDPVESRRWHLLWKVSLGWTIKDSAVAVGISYDYGKEIVKKYNDLGETGVENLKSKHKRGKKSLLTKEQLENLGKELESRPSDGGDWNGPKVARWIEKETGVEKVWNQRGWDYIKKAQVLMANSEIQTEKKKSHRTRAIH